MANSGKVTLAGAGPGDPGLITARALAALGQADVVVYDYLANARLLALAPPGAERIYVGKHGSAHTLEQPAINQLLAARATAGKRVVRLKGGDPYLFGRGGEEAAFLTARGIAVEVIAGIPAAIGAAACAGIPLTDRRCASAVTFVTGHEDPTKPAAAVDWRALARVKGTLVVYMGMRRLPQMVAALIDGGLAPTTPAAIVAWATTPRQRTVVGALAALPDLASQVGLAAPAVVIIGEVVRQREHLAWFEARPLFGRRLVVTRSREQAGALTELLEALGAEVREVPVIQLLPPSAPAALAAASARLAEYDWVVFTSANGVAAVMRELWATGRDARALGGVRLAAIGPATAHRLAEYGLRPDFCPETFTVAALAQGLGALGPLAGRRFLLARAEVANEVLPRALRAAGAEVACVAAYRTAPAEFDAAALRQDLAAGQTDGITFTSASTVHCLVEGVGREFVATHAAVIAGLSIGPETSAAMREYGLEPRAEATTHTIPGLAAAIAAHFAPRSASPLAECDGDGVHDEEPERE